MAAASEGKEEAKAASPEPELAEEGESKVTELSVQDERGLSQVRLAKAARASGCKGPTLHRKRRCFPAAPSIWRATT